ncbi:hypothetical protein NP590_06295 [Methylomonas sp. SURF-2]|uniref:Uncharacterized protein n=1 Tax=Methylomonas subterranea TaxID=2952225 RepID=A0ABT1TE20_9GAMM|nr:hypothetical protein [Methylomonas sp. SURF-2]MCQ8103708.1 hypothetical protein [Methylomonas sp. SURF-2]
MTNKVSFNQEAVKQAAGVQLQPMLAVQGQPLAVSQELQLQGNLFQTQLALNNEVMLSSNLLKYDLTYKPPTKEVFSAPQADQQASIAHIDSLFSVLERFNLSLKTLQDDLGREDADSNASLRAKTQAFLQKYRDDADVAPLFKDEMREGQLKSYRDIFAARNEDIRALTDDASKLFHSGRLLLKETQVVGNLQGRLLLLQRTVLKRLLNLRDDKQRLASEITQARGHLDALNRTRLEDAGDYALAQRLVSEDWRRVETDFQKRRAILENYSGLYYVRVRETAAGRLLPDARPLRGQSAGDPVPGCSDIDTELPDDLAPFMDTLLDIPLADWRVLQNDAHLLPGRARQTQLLDIRRQRLSGKVNRTQSVGNRLSGLLQVNTQLLTVFAGKSPPQSASLLQQFGGAHALLSLEDILTGSPALLSGKAQALQTQLTRAAGCLLRELAGVRPSIRFRWAQLAEDRQLPIEQPERWPNLAEVESADFSRVRTLVELVHWFYRQLAETAGDHSRAAVTHLLGACVLIAASDDPEQILHGNLKTLPGIFRPGELLRLNLNRVAAPGQTLQLLDAQRQVVGVLRVDDHDQNGTVATLMQVYQPIAAREGLSVSGKLAMGRIVPR